MSRPPMFPGQVGTFNYDGHPNQEVLVLDVDDADLPIRGWVLHERYPIDLVGAVVGPAEGVAQCLRFDRLDGSVSTGLVHPRDPNRVALRVGSGWAFDTLARRFEPMLSEDQPLPVIAGVRREVGPHAWSEPGVDGRCSCARCGVTAPTELVDRRPRNRTEGFIPTEPPPLANPTDITRRVWRAMSANLPSRGQSIRRVATPSDPGEAEQGG